MTDGRITGPPSPDEREDGYLQGPPEAIAGLKAKIAREIREKGPIRFDRFMDRALYEPELGYYAQPGRLVGINAGAGAPTAQRSVAGKQTVSCGGPVGPQLWCVQTVAGVIGWQQVTRCDPIVDR